MEKLWDLLTFLAVLLLPSLAVIIYFLFYRPIKSSQDFMYGKYGVHWTCAGVSLAGCFIGPITLLWPAEFVRSGSTWLLGIAAAFLIAVPIVAIVHLPVLHYSRSTSVYQYLEARFQSKFLRYTAFGFSQLSGVLFCVGILVLSGELAQQSLRVTIVGEYARRWMCILILAALTGTSASLGGQKAAVFLGSFTLVFEFVVALICAVAMALYRRTSMPISSSGRIDISSNGTADDEYGTNSSSSGVPTGGWLSSMLVPDYRLGSTVIDRQNVWLTTSACLLYTFYALGCHQTSHQHYCAVSRIERRARFALLTSAVMFLIVWSLSFILFGMVSNLYGQHDELVANCFSSNNSSSSSSPSAFRLLLDPYASLEKFFKLTWPSTNGAVGYFLGCFTCVCAFCTLPSSFVSLASSAYEDLIKPYYCINAEEHRQTMVLKILTGLVAFVCTSGALLLSELLLVIVDHEGGGQFWWLYAKNVSLTLATWTAPFAALYVLAIWLPCTNGKGAIVGLVCGLSLTLTLCVLHTSQLPIDSNIQEPNSLLFACCSAADRNATSYMEHHGSPRRGGRALLMEARMSNYTDNIIPGMEKNWTGGFDQRSISSSTSTFDRQQQQIVSSSVCSGYERLVDANEYKKSLSWIYRISLPLQSLISFLVTILIGLVVSLVTGRQDILTLDWNLVYWTCNGLQMGGSCFGGTGGGDTHHGGGFLEWGGGGGGGGKKKRRGQRGPYTTSESFRYSKQGPFPDTSYLNPKVQDYMATLTRTQTSEQK